jgi:thiol-disulfide isomerase/thioredoxin
MTKIILIVGIVLVLAGLVIIGTRDIRKFTSREANTPVVVASGAAEPGAAPADGVETIRFVKNPGPVPNFTVKDLDGNTITPADWRGKVVVINFWATWCGPCKEEIPDLVMLQNKYQGKLQMIGMLSSDDSSADAVRKFIKETGMNYPVAVASQELESKFGGIMGLPTSFVVDTDGRIVQKHIGLRNPALYDAEIRALLQMPVQAKIETFEDQGQVLLSNAKNATELPGVDFSKLSAEQKKAALRQLNEQGCTCGCGLTLAQCRINDTSCAMSQKMAQEVVAKIVAK